MTEHCARIVRTTLGRHEHYGIWSAELRVDYAVSTVAEVPSGAPVIIGGHALDTKPGGDGRRHGTAWGMEFLIRLLDAVPSARSWEDLPGKLITVFLGDARTGLGLLPALGIGPALDSRNAAGERWWGDRCFMFADLAPDDEVADHLAALERAAAAVLAADRLTPVPEPLGVALGGLRYALYHGGEKPEPASTCEEHGCPCSRSYEPGTTGTFGPHAWEVICGLAHIDPADGLAFTDGEIRRRAAARAPRLHTLPGPTDIAAARAARTSGTRDHVTVYAVGYVGDGGIGGFDWDYFPAKARERLETAEVGYWVGPVDVLAGLTIDATTEWLSERPELWDRPPGVVDLVHTSGAHGRGVRVRLTPAQVDALSEWVGTFHGAPIGIDRDPPAVCVGPLDVNDGDWVIYRDDGGWSVASADSGWVPARDRAAAIAEDRAAERQDREDSLRADGGDPRD